MKSRISSPVDVLSFEIPSIRPSFLLCEGMMDVGSYTTLFEEQLLLPVEQGDSSRVVCSPVSSCFHPIPTQTPLSSGQY